jgi:hypothetical protein
MRFFLNKRLLIAGLVLLLFGQMQSCYYDNEEELYFGACDTTNVTYSLIVAPIMAGSCNVCHSGNFPNAGIRTDNYADLKSIADNGRLWGAINHEPGFSPMPQNQPKMNECNLARIRKWIDSGAPDN